MTDFSQDFTAQVANCARCDGDHPPLLFKRVITDKPWTHIATCPTKNEPVYLEILAIDEG